MTASKSRRRAARPDPSRPKLLQLITAAMEDMKAVNLKVLDVRGLTDIADHMVIASGNSDRHVRSIAELVAQRAKQEGFRPLGTEGSRDGEWVLVDLQDVLVHVMLPRVREFYGLEALWDNGVRRRAPRSAAKAGSARGSATTGPLRRRRKASAAPSGS